MIMIIAKNILKPGIKEGFKSTAAELIAKSQAEEGCISYDLYQDINDENVVTFIESWKDQQAIDLHNSSEHFTRIVPQLAQYKDGGDVNLYVLAD